MIRSVGEGQRMDRREEIEKKRGRERGERKRGREKRQDERADGQE